MVIEPPNPEEICGFDMLDKIVMKHFGQEIESVDVHVQWLRFSVKGDTKRYILRVWEYPDNDTGIFTLKREVRFLKYCQQIGFPHVLSLHTYDFDQNILEFDYYIYEFIEGREFFQLAQELNSHEKSILYTNLGTVIGRMHSHRYDYRAELVMSEQGHVDVVPADEWKYDPNNDWIYDHFQQIYEYAEKYDELKPYVVPIEQLFYKYGEFRKDPPRTIALVHIDLASDNLIVMNKGESIDDFYMIDFTFAGISRISVDLGRIERRFTTWRDTLPLNEVDTYLNIMMEAYQQEIEIPSEYIKEEAVIFQLIQIIDDFWMFEKEDHWLSQDTERGMKVRLWELDRLIEKYL